jgi:hypothetical protein
MRVFSAARPSAFTSLGVASVIVTPPERSSVPVFAVTCCGAGTISEATAVAGHVAIPVFSVKRVAAVSMTLWSAGCRCCDLRSANGATNVERSSVLVFVMTLGLSVGAATYQRGMTSVSAIIQNCALIGMFLDSLAANPLNFAVGSSLCRSPTTWVMVNWSLPTHATLRMLLK